MVDTEAIEEQTVVFECILSKAKYKKTGSYVPVRWYKGKREIRHGNKYSIDSDENIHRLKIKDLSFDDQLPYSVVVDSEKSTANLMIKGIIAYKNLISKYKNFQGFLL